MSDEQRRYRVRFGPVQVRYAKPTQTVGAYRIGGGHFYDGEILPEIDPVQLRHLLDLRMIEPVEEIESATAEPAEEGAAC